MEDSERLTLGLWIDFIIDCINLDHKAEHKDNETAKSRKATQADFDLF